MWGIFLESVVIFKNYMGYHENHFLAGIYHNTHLQKPQKPVVSLGILHKPHKHFSE